MTIRAAVLSLGISGACVTLVGCGGGGPPPMARPAGFMPLGLNAPYLSGDLIGGTRARAQKIRAAKVSPLNPAAAPAYMADLDGELRRQTAGIGLDVLRVGESIVIRIPAGLTFDAGSASVKPQFDATLKEIARTVKARPQTYVDVFAHTDTNGSAAFNQTLSDKRAAAVATYLSGHGVVRGRIASRGYGESSPLFIPERSETELAANRRVEIRLVPYRL